MAFKRSGWSEYVAVHTAKSDQTWLTFPISQVFERSEVSVCSPAFEIRALSSGDIEVIVCAEQTDENNVWPASTATPVLFDGATITSRTTEGVTYAAVFEDLNAKLTKRYVRFSVRVRNRTGTSTLESCWAAVRLEFKRC